MTQEPTEDLVQWLRAQLDEDERIARGASGRAGQEGGAGWEFAEMQVRAGDGALVVRHTWPREGEHIAAHDPTRVLREIDAKRRIVSECDWGGPDHADVYEAVLQRLALPYADRPGYCEGWRP